MENNIENSIQNQIVQFNRMYKAYDDIYQNAAKKFNMPKLSLWVIYVLRQNSVCTQKDLVEQLYYPKQSLNSALKSLEEKGYVVLELLENDRRSKPIRLTEKGIAFAKDTVDKIIQAENDAFAKLDDSERKTLFDLFDRLSSVLREEMGKVK